MAYLSVLQFPKIVSFLRRVNMKAMGAVRSAGIARAKQILVLSFGGTPRNSSVDSGRVPKGHFAVYVGEMEKRFVVPISYLRNPLFQSLLRKAEEEYGFEHPRGVLRVPCNEDAFVALTSQITIN
ncbi:auxin-induced protein 15A-like [Canna indica]|uniref:Auxin-induced protein 15A-like n=1 Tax=Canna indica TaxID=4628 RepID=A0AAQ3KQR4_9LILI|nr:auxin-induced protein 15A-like [Canna indica]